MNAVPHLKAASYTVTQTHTTAVIHT